MNKGIELTPSQIEAYKRGATMFILPCPTDLKQRDIMSQDLGFHMLYSGYISKYIEVYCPIQKGDKDIQVRTQEYEIGLTDDEIYSIGCAYQGEQYQKTYDIIGKIKECIDVKVVNPKRIARKGYFDGADINENVLEGLGLKWIGYMSRESYEDIGYKLFVNLYNQQMKERNINRTYEDNDYVFLMEFKR